MSIIWQEGFEHFTDGGDALGIKYPDATFVTPEFADGRFGGKALSAETSLTTLRIPSFAAQSFFVVSMNLRPEAIVDGTFMSFDTCGLVVRLIEGDAANTVRFEFVVDDKVIGKTVDILDSFKSYEFEIDLAVRRLRLIVDEIDRLNIPNFPYLSETETGFEIHLVATVDGVFLLDDLVVNNDGPIGTCRIIGARPSTNEGSTFVTSDASEMNHLLVDEVDTDLDVTYNMSDRPGLLDDLGLEPLEEVHGEILAVQVNSTVYIASGGPRQIAHRFGKTDLPVEHFIDDLDEHVISNVVQVHPLTGEVLSPKTITSLVTGYKSVI